MSLSKNYRIASAFGRSLPEFCARYGIAIAAVAPEFGIDSSAFAETDGCVSLFSFNALLEHLARVTDDDIFALKYAAEFNLGDTGPFGFGLMHAPTFEDAIRFCARYAALKADFSYFEADISATSVEIKWGYSPLIAPNAQITDLMTVLGLRQLRHFTGSAWKASIAELQRPKPRSIGEHLHHVASSLKFSARSNAIRFSGDWLRSENPHADPRLFQIMDRLCGEARDRNAENEDLVLRVRKQVTLSLASRSARLGEVAKELGMSERNLQRKLAGTKLSFEQIVEETRRELSDLLICATNMPLTEIGRRLGYASPNAYSRAAKNWYGETARQFREKHLLKLGNQAPVTTG